MWQWVELLRSPSMNYCAAVLNYCRPSRWFALIFHPTYKYWVHRCRRTGQTNGDHGGAIYDTVNYETTHLVIIFHRALHIHSFRICRRNRRLSSWGRTKFMSSSVSFFFIFRCTLRVTNTRERFSQCTHVLEKDNNKNKNRNGENIWDIKDFRLPSSLLTFSFIILYMYFIHSFHSDSWMKMKFYADTNGRKLWWCSLVWVSRVENVW